MNITEVRIKLMDEPGERLKAFCSITFDDCFVIRDLKIIEGTSGPFVAMPSRKLTAHCGKCGMKNHLRGNYCNQCGTRLEEGRIVRDAEGRTKLYADIAHPINSRCREMIQQRVVTEYHDELERAKSPDYVSRYDDYDGGDYSEADAAVTTTTRRFDEPHERTQGGRPHHPPQGDPMSAPAPTAPHFGPQGIDARGRVSEVGDHSIHGPSDALRGDSQARGGGFGAGIF
ncbi:MAG: septation protein SpoVG family protein [Lacipirellulaceae bacterium]